MRRRKAAKTQRPNTLKRHNAPKVTRHRKPLAADANERVAQLTRERDEALEQQTATSEVLKVISSSRAQLKPVFETIVDRTTRICGRHSAALGSLKKMHSALRQFPVPPRTLSSSILNGCTNRTAARMLFP
jgi:hypothetical protein